MREIWIILKMVDEEDVDLGITELEEIAATKQWPNSETLMTFGSLSEASDYQEEHSIDGQCIQLGAY